MTARRSPRPPRLGPHRRTQPPVPAPASGGPRAASKEEARNGPRNSHRGGRCPQNSNRWQRLAAELADKEDRPESVRKGPEMARAKRRARLRRRKQRDRTAARRTAPNQEPPDGKPGGTSAERPTGCEGAGPEVREIPAATAGDDPAAATRRCRVNRPLLLDAYCCAGAASKGYARRRVRRDRPRHRTPAPLPIRIRPRRRNQTPQRPRVHGPVQRRPRDPPCQRKSKMTVCRPGLAATYPDLIAPTLPPRRVGWPVDHRKR